MLLEQLAKTLLIEGPVGALEVVVTERPSALATAIVCHPHSLYGGSLQNKVVTTLARMFNDLDLRTVRFNFRGVGKSGGSFDAGIGETEDLIAVAAWVRQQYLTGPLWLAGFSFGSYVAAKAAFLLKPSQLISVAPPVINFDFNKIAPIDCPWVVVQGEEDEIVPPKTVYQWIATLYPRPILIRISGASHFFHGQLMELRRQLQAVLPAQ